MNNSSVLTVPNLCSFRESGWFADVIVMPVYFIFGLFGHVLCLIAFYHQSKSESAYGYQIFIVVSETVKIFTYALYEATIQWLADGELIPLPFDHSWFKSSYICMWITTHLALPLCNVFITLTSLSTLAMAVDRAFALRKPILYRKKSITVAIKRLRSACVLLSEFLFLFFLICALTFITN
jgi:hypothetical protein